MESRFYLKGFGPLIGHFSMNINPDICWILQKNLTPPQILEQIKQTLIAQGVDFQEVTIIPFSNTLPKGIDPEKLNIFYGSTTLMLNVYESDGLNTGLFYDATKFTMRNYIQQWGTRMLNVQAQFFTVQELATKDFDLDSQWFIRPNGDTKAFSGALMSFAQIKGWYAKIAPLSGGSVSSDTEVMIAPPKMPEKEWRCFIVDQKLVAACRYAKQGYLAVSQEDIPTEMLTFVQACIDQYTPHAIFVMDVALYQDDYYLLECGCLNSTGFYEANVARVVMAINAYCLRNQLE